MKTKHIFLSILLLIGINLFAQKEQKPEIIFEELEHDFGTIPEESGSVTYEFKFKNTGKADLLLTNVQASCGCTTPDWTKEPVPAKKEGIIKVTYSTNARPGYFNKSITITSNAEKQVLTITGIVTPEGQTIEKTYPVEIGTVRLQQDNVDFWIDDPAKPKSIKMGVYNSSTQEATLKFSGLPKYLKVKSVTLVPNEKGNIEFVLDPAKMKEGNEINAEIKMQLKQKGKEKIESILKIHAKKPEPAK